VSDELHLELAARLRDAHRRVAALDLQQDEKAGLIRRLIALTDASKHDVAHAAQRLNRFLGDLDDHRPSGPGLAR
jgi:hypothetical protein